ncbi:MAG: putative acylesterase/phospholipase RssA [Francisellaceae bacterium]
MPLDDITHIFENQKSSRLISLNYKFWNGLFSLKKFIQLLEKYLPNTFTDLSIPFAVGVCDKNNNHRLINTGELVLPVVASGAVPKLFKPIYYNENYYVDGAVVGRLGLSAWCELRPNTEIIVHNIASSRIDFKYEQPKGNCFVVNTPRSKSSLFGKTYFQEEVEKAFNIAMREIDHSLNKHK